MKIATLLVLSSILIWSCANRGSPGGGPVDRTPPYVVQTIPATDSTFVSQMISKITIEFSERMDEGSLSQAVFLSPPLKYEVSWSGSRILNLEIQDTLLKNQTYVVSIGTDAADERNNKMDHSVQFAFSTGSQVDRGSISGKVVGLARNEKSHIFGFPVRDSIDQKITNINPLFITQSGNDGSYNLEYLKPDNYRILAVLDQNNNLVVDADYEKVGIPFRDVQLTDSMQHFDQLNFRLTRIDTIPPKFTGARAMNRTNIQLRFSEPILSETPFSFTIIDSLSEDTLSILALSKNPESENILDVYTYEMDSLAMYKVTIPELSDTSGNVNTSVMQTSFLPKMTQDTTSFKIVSFSPADSAKKISPLEKIKLEFSNPVNWQSVFNNFWLQNSDSDTVAGDWDIKSVKLAEFNLELSLTPDSSYYMYLNTGGVINLWGNTLEDSVISHYFTVISSRELGEISGSIRGLTDYHIPVRLIMKQIGRTSANQETIADSTGSYIFYHLPEGMYQISGYIDLDQNGLYLPGNLFPFQFSEPFFMREDTIKVRKRWESQGNLITVPSIK